MLGDREMPSCRQAERRDESGANWSDSCQDFLCVLLYCCYENQFVPAVTNLTAEHSNVSVVCIMV